MQKLLRLFSLLALATIGSLISVKAQCGAFYDGFETGAIGPQWTFGTGTYTRTVPNTNSAVGTYHLQQASTTTGSFNQGMTAIFTPSQPTYISYWMRTNTTTGANGYVVIGNSSLTTDNGIIFCYFNATSQLRFFNTTGQNYPITANTWYHVEARNINWTSRNMDIWINGSLYLTGWAFRSPSANTIDRISLFSLVAAEPKYDEFQIGLGGPAITNVSTISPACFGDTTGSIDITATTINGSMTYAWSNGAITQDLMNVTSGNYVVTVTDSLGCTTNDSIALAGPSQIAPTAAATDVVCPGGSDGAIDLSVTGGSPGYTYMWSTSDTAQDLSNLQAGTYVLTVTDLNGCNTVDSFAVGEPAPFGDSAVVTSPTCPQTSDGSIDLSVWGANGGYSFLWSNGAISEDVAALINGTYSVVVSDSMGCSFQDSFVLSSASSVTSNSVIDEPACFGFGNGSIDLTPSGGTPVYTYIWSTGASSEDLPFATAGTYTVTITDANGCIAIDTILLTEPAPIVPSGAATPSTGTNNGSVNLTVTGGTAPFTYIWSNGGNTEDISGLQGPGNFSVIITDANGCQALDTFFVDDVIAITNGLGSSLTAYPNPFEASFTVELQAIGIDAVTLTLTDLAGKRLWEAAEIANGSTKVVIDLPAGIYLLQMKQGDSIATVKMIRR